MNGWMEINESGRTRLRLFCDNEISPINQLVSRNVKYLKVHVISLTNFKYSSIKGVTCSIHNGTIYPFDGLKKFKTFSISYIVSAA